MRPSNCLTFAWLLLGVCLALAKDSHSHRYNQSHPVERQFVLKHPVPGVQARALGQDAATFGRRRTG